MTRKREASTGARTVRKPPAWYDGAAYGEAASGLPGFVTIAWLDTWTGVEPGQMRRLHEHVLPRAEFSGWWPQTRPSPDDLGYLLSMAMRRPAEFAALTRHYAHICGRPGPRRFSFFRKLHDGEAVDPVQRLFVELLEDPATMRADAAVRLTDLAALGHAEAVADLSAWIRVAMPGILPGEEGAAPVEAAIEPAPDAIPAAIEPGTVDPVAESSAAAERGAATFVADEAAPAVLSEGIPTTEAPAAPAAASGDPELDAAVRACRVSLEGVRAAVDAGLASGAVGRAAVRPVLLALREAAREGRRHDALLAAPVPIDALVAGIRALVARVDGLRPGQIPAWAPSGEGGVPRRQAASLADEAGALAVLASGVEAAFAAVEARGREMMETKNFDLAVEVQELNKVLASEIARLGTALSDTADRITHARAEAAAARVAAAIRPAAAAMPSAALSVPGVRPAPLLPVHVCSVAFRLIGTDGGFQGAVGACLRWMEGKVGPLPGDAASGAPFEATAEGAGVRGVMVPLAQGRFWAGRLREEDRREPGRAWIVEACIGEEGSGGLRFAVRVRALSPDGRPPGPRMLPRLVREVLAEVTGVDASRSLKDEAVDLVGEEGAKGFHALVFDQGRRLPVVAFAAGGASASAIEATARQLAGAAHVVTLDRAAAGLVARRLGRGWSLEPGAARLYAPEADPAAAVPARLALGAALVRRLDGTGDLARHIGEEVLRETEPLFAREGIPDFEDLLDRATSSARETADARAEEAGIIPHEFVERHREEVERLRHEREDANALLQSVEEDIRQVEDENIEAWSRNAALQAEIERLNAALAAAKVAPPPAVPRTLEEICAFAETGLGTGIVVMPKAVRETGRTRNLNVRRLYDGLVFLRDKYLPLRRGELDHKDYLHALKEHQFEESPCFTQRGTGQCFTGYAAHWKGRKIELDRHLKWGHGSTDTMIRIYFHYDEAEQVVVIGHMPSHLDNFRTD